MVIVQSYPVAVALCFVTMLCWGSWANTQKLAEKDWRFQLFYWDYAIGVVLISVLLALTMGSTGTEGRRFAADLAQAATPAVVSALIGGVVFNIANILLVAAIDIAGMSVAFPIGIGLALVIGVLTNFIADPVGNAALLFLGVAGVTLAIVVDALAYRRLPSVGMKTTGKGIAVSIIAGLLMGFFYRFVAASMVSDFAKPEPGKLTPYTAVVLFSIGLFLSNFVWNSLFMVKPLVGDPVPFADYFRQGTPRLHAIGVLGGAIWGIGMSFSIIASGQAGVAISYGLGQGATMIAALWGVFVWKEFRQASPGTGKLLGLMFFGYVAGLALIIAARIA
jgi:glucose uptake protein